MSTPYSQFYTPIRVVLGDRDPHGLYSYPDTDLDGAINVIFMTGAGPANFTADAAARTISPDLQAGDDWAVILFQAALFLIEGEDGAGSMRTKALFISDQGHRKRDLITSLRLKLSAIETGGGLAFITRQALGVFLQNLTGESMLDWIDAADYKLPVTILPVALYINPIL